MEYPFKDLLPLDEVLEREGYYKDWTHLDPEVFYSLTQISEYIKTKGFGVDVRLLIAQLAEHFSLKTSQINEIERFFKDVMQELAEEKDYYSLPEIAGARGGFDTLGDRLNYTTAQLAQKVGNGKKAEPEDLSERSIALMTGQGTVDLLTIPQNKSVTSTKLDDRLNRITTMADAVIQKKDVHAPYQVEGKPDESTTQLFMKFIYDTSGAGLVHGQPVRIKFKYHTDSSNLGNIQALVYGTNEIETPTGGVEYGFPILDSPIIKGQVVERDITLEPYDSRQRYIHFYLQAKPIDRNVVSKYNVANISVSVGEKEVTNLVVADTQRIAEGGTFTQEWFEPYYDIRGGGTILDDIMNVKNSLVNLQPDNPKTLHAKSIHNTTTDMYLMEYVVDLEGLGLVNGQPINTSFMYYTEDNTLTDLTADIYLLNVDTPNTYAGGLTFANNTPSPLSLGEIASYSEEFGIYNSGYRYAHVFIRAFITDHTIYHDFSLAEFTLKIGDVTVPYSRVLSVNPHRVSADSTLLTQWPVQALRAVSYSDLSKELSELDRKIENGMNLAPSRFNGGKWNFLGDSITDPNHGGASVKYWVHLKEMFGLAEARPYGISSSTISNAPNAQAHQPMSVRYTEMDDDADIVTVFAGTNDYGYSDAAWGVFYNEDGTVNKDDTTLYGACHVLFEGLVKKYASRGTTIFIATPIPRQSITAPNPTTGKLLKDYVQVIKEVAAFYSLPVLDLFTMSGLQANVPEIKTAYVPDGVHPNNKGHVVLANKFAGMLRTL